MAIIVNGINIPTNGDYIKVGNTIVDKVICNGVTVWEKKKDEFTGSELVVSLGGMVDTSGRTSFSDNWFSYNLGSSGSTYGFIVDKVTADADDGAGNWFTPAARIVNPIDVTGYSKIEITTYRDLEIETDDDPDEGEYGWYNTYVLYRENSPINERFWDDESEEWYEDWDGVSEMLSSPGTVTKTITPGTTKVYLGIRINTKCAVEKTGAIFGFSKIKLIK